MKRRTLCSVVLIATASLVACEAGNPTNPLAAVTASAAWQAGQQATVGTQLPVGPEVLVTDSHGNPVSGVTVAFAGDGSVGAASVETDANGKAGTTWTLGTAAGTQSVTATVVGLTGSPVSFTATGLAASAAVMSASASWQTGQEAPVETALPVAPAVLVTDIHGNPVEGVQVTFAGDGTVQNASVQTDGLGVASTAWTMGPLPAAQNLTATASGLPAVTFTATAISDEPQPTASSVIWFEDDFESYTDCQSMEKANGGKWDAVCSGGIVSPAANTGYLGDPTSVGGRSAEFDWPQSDTEQFAPLTGNPAGSTPGNGVSTFISYYYRAPNFVYVGPFPRLEKKHLLINLAFEQGITVVIGRNLEFAEGAKLVKFEWTVMQTNGLRIFDHETQVGPWGASPGTIDYVTNGDWHRITIERKSESSAGAGDGAFRIWLDGVKIIDGTTGRQAPSIPATTAILTGNGGVSNFQLASTFNGGSPQNQQDYYDNVIVWYNN